MSAKAVLIAARKLINEVGWCQKVAFGPNNTRCMLGAITPASSGGTWGDYYQAMICLAKAINPDRGILSVSEVIVTFNDRPGQSKANVLAAFDRAIETIQR